MTNSEDFAAHVTVAGNRGATQGVWPLAGNLFQQQGRVLFVPTSDESTQKSPWAGSFRFLWDIRGNSGYVLSERLQAYAQASAPVQYGGVTPKGLLMPIAEKLVDHDCHLEEVTVEGSDKSSSPWRVWRATEFNGLPLRITSLPNTNEFRIELSQVAFEAQLPDLFQVPPSFTQYKNPEAMVNDLVRRQKRPPPPDVGSGRRGRRSR